jgi:flagellar basal body-associated protein FliL
MAEPGTKSKGGAILIPALLITIIAAVGGAVFGALVLSQGASDGAQAGIGNKTNSPRKKSHAKGKHGKKDKHAEKSAKAEGGGDRETIIALPAIVTNLNGAGKNWIRLETSIISKPGSEDITAATQKRLAQDIMSFLRQSKLQEFEGAVGLINLRSDLAEIVRIRTQGRAEELVVHGMVVE